MALALLLGTAAAAAGFIVTSFFGFVVAAHGPHDPMIRFLVTRHVLYAIPTLLLSLFSQSMVLFYFIGTGRLVKDEMAGWADDRRIGVLRALRRFKAKTSPPATFAMLAAIAAFVLGGWVHTAAPGIRGIARIAHLSASVGALVIHLWALLAEYPAFVENHRLMADPAAYAGGDSRQPAGS
ncbi:MAG TPA: hypothetical protein VFS34_17060 [Thermoanaerobaculia bacterium]|nr:hypothetical protein [Thermoanaerobaculia bacterium]